MDKPRVFAFYLPQFYPTPENDKWWEPGFTEWTNVATSKPLFKGHYQPRIPQELSFYDLRVPETRNLQAEMAREAGIEGFCYWHYWFGNGKRLLDRVFREVVETGKPDFPFSLCWANHSWYQKTWDASKPNKLLMKQEYPGVEDYVAHFMELLPAFRDPRYTRVNGKLFFGIFEPKDFPDFPTFKATWNRLAEVHGLGGFNFFALVQGSSRMTRMSYDDYDDIVYDPMSDLFLGESRLTHSIKWRLRLPAMLRDYSSYVKSATKMFDEYPNVIPCIVPNFDHSPRSQYKGTILHGSTPQLWGQLCREVKKRVEARNGERVILIKSWNEWGEGNYLEPDRKFGREYLIETGKAFR